MRHSRLTHGLSHRIVLFDVPTDSGHVRGKLRFYERLTVEARVLPPVAPCGVEVPRRGRANR
jgi:hypothetical protein